MQRISKLPASPFLYPIVNSCEELNRQITTGYKIIQYRRKNMPQEDIKLTTRNADQLVIINDDINLLHDIGADGLHLGQDDLDKFSKTTLIDRDFILGISTHRDAEIMRALEFKPDYIAFGTIFHTTSKIMNYPPQGLARLKEVVSQASVPVIAIGGINRQNLQDVFATGVAGAAGISMFVERP